MGSQCWGGSCGWRTPRRPQPAADRGPAPLACPLLWAWGAACRSPGPLCSPAGSLSAVGPGLQPLYPVGLYKRPHPVLPTGSGWVGAGQVLGPDARGGVVGRGQGQGLWSPDAASAGGPPPPPACPPLLLLLRPPCPASGSSYLPGVLLEPSTASTAAAWPLLPHAPSPRASAYPPGPAEPVSAPRLPPPGVTSIF